MDKKLRVGLLLDSMELPAWLVTAVKRTLLLNHAEISLLILNRAPQRKESLLQTLRRSPRHALYHVFHAIDEKIFLRTSNASALMDASGILCNVPILRVCPVEENGQHRVPPSDVEQIRSHRLDVLVKVGFGHLRGDVLSAARFGVWAYRWGDPQKIEEGLTSFWEAAERWDETGAALQQLGARGEPNTILFESHYFTYPYSPARSRNYIQWAAASFLPRQLDRLHRLGEAAFFQERRQGVAASATRRSNGLPSNLAMAGILLRLMGRNLHEIFHRIFYRDQWELLFDFSDDPKNELTTFQRIPPSDEGFWADPHIVYQEPNYYIFVEEYPYRTKRGHISVIEMEPDGNCKPPVPVLKKDCHLSFPFVFPWKGRYYMIPESSAKRTIDLYECTQFPDQWQHKRTLMSNVKAVDTTVIFLNGRWWMFTAIAEQEAAAPQVELFLFHAEDLFTDCWQPHPMNPVVSDVKRARGAGGVFLKDGKLFRPSQDCSRTYGYGFDLNEIVTLTETDYCERTVRSVRPGPQTRFIATHTYASQKNLTVVDALTRRPKWAKTP